MRRKEVICIKDGTRLGFVSDVEVDVKTAKLVAIIVYGKLKCFGLLGRYDDFIIAWDNIEIIGEDTILVSYNHHHKRKKRKVFANLLRS